MSWRVPAIVLAGAALIAVLVWLLARGPGPEPAPREVVEAGAPTTPTAAPEQQIVLLFVGRDGRLHPELRSIPLPAEADARVGVVVEQLLLGSSAGLGPVVPYRAELSAVFVDDAGRAFVDLTAPPGPLGGSHTELMLAYGVVDSVLLNCPDLHAVQLLFGGREVDTLTGHLDLSRPLVLNKRFIAAS